MCIVLIAVDIDEVTINPSHDTGIVGKMLTLNCTVDISPPEDVVSPLPLEWLYGCLLYTSPSPRDATLSRMPSSA